MSQENKSGGGYAQRVNKEAREYVEEILKENERLRLQVTKKEHELETRREAFERAMSLELENRHLKEMVSLLEDQVRGLKKQHLEALSDVAQVQGRLVRLERQVAQAETENREFFDQYSLIEKQNTNLLNLYVTSYRIHGTLDRKEVLDGIKETIINLVGSEEFVVYELDSETGVLRLAISFGIDPDDYREIPMGRGPIGQATARGETFVSGPLDGPAELPGGKRLLALIPFKLGQEISGAVAILSLLPQKNGTFEDVDHELFDLLATHAATALYCTRLHRIVSEKGQTA